MSPMKWASVEYCDTYFNGFAYKLNNTNTVEVVYMLSAIVFHISLFFAEFKLTESPSV